jgi:hypothetical protein
MADRAVVLVVVRRGRSVVLVAGLNMAVMPVPAAVMGVGSASGARGLRLPADAMIVPIQRVQTPLSQERNRSKQDKQPATDRVGQASGHAQSYSTLAGRAAPVSQRVTVIAIELQVDFIRGCRSGFRRCRFQMDSQ